mmetsp:Transcript_7235/g.16051  ORF Transcript_7235/g.16051 Transcript_7235/m.16051 type:complete len:245 (+) Transcript_7235:440-1174(+)
MVCSGFRSANWTHEFLMGCRSSNCGAIRCLERRRRRRDGGCRRCLEGGFLSARQREARLQGRQGCRREEHPRERLGSYRAHAEGDGLRRDQRRIDPGRAAAGHLQEGDQRMGRAQRNRRHWLRHRRHRKHRGIAGIGPGGGAAGGERQRRRRLRRRAVPARQKGAHARAPAHADAPAPAHQHLRRGDAHPQRPRLRHPHLFPEQRLHVRQLSHHHRLGLRGCRRDVPGDHPRRVQASQDTRWRC